MSKALINRSLTTIKTELEFLLDSEVITQNFYDTVEKALPARYVAGVPPADLSSSVSTSSATAVVVETSSSSVKAQEASINSSRQELPPPSYEAAQEWREALYDYQKQAPEDLEFSVGDRIKVLEKPNPNWYKGEINGRSGMFPVNYTKESSADSSASSKKDVATHAVSAKPIHQPSPQPYVQQQSYGQPQSYSQPQYQPQQYQPQQYQPQQYQPQPFPPPSVNYYQQPEQPQQPQQSGSNKASGAFKGFGKRLGEAAIFGAGATIGGDIVNSIF